jgi:hypothetical protein
LQIVRRCGEEGKEIKSIRENQGGREGNEEGKEKEEEKGKGRQQRKNEGRRRGK